MKKHIIFGGFDYAVYWEMNADAILKGIDYFVDNSDELIGTTYLGKPIYAPEKLLEENKEDIVILIGSIVYHTEIEFQLNDMGFEKDINYQWAISFIGDEGCGRLWHYTEWNDKKKNAENLKEVETGEYWLSRLKCVARIIDFDHIKTVVDLGAANGRMQEFIPDGVEYIPVDYIPYSKDTVVCNLNEYEFPSIMSDVATTCYVLVETIGYVHDWKWLLAEIAKKCNDFICVHNDFVRINREYRRMHFNRNSVMFNHEIIIELQKLGYTLVEAYDYRLRTVIMHFKK